jgi:hypothetical protein
MLSRKRRRGEGKTCERLAEELGRRGIVVDFWVFARGYWASQDVFRWEVWGTSKGTGDCANVPAGMRVHVGGWNPATACLRDGFDLSRTNRDLVGHFEANQSSRSKA